MPGEERSKLWEKCRLAKVEEVRKALEEGADPNTTDGERGITCLMAALEKKPGEGGGPADLLSSHRGERQGPNQPHSLALRLLEGQRCHVGQAASGARSLAQREDGQGQDSDHGGDKVWKA